MKKLLFILMAVLSLCACSSDDGEQEIRNVFTVDGKEYPIDRVRYSKWNVHLYSGEDCLDVYNLDCELGKKCYLSAYESPEASVTKQQHNGVVESYELVLPAEEMDKSSSYVWIKENENDNRTYIEVYVTSNRHKISARYLGTAYKN